MSKYKAGDKVALEITGINELGAYKFGNTMYSWLIAENFVDEYAKPLSEYTEKLKKKNEKMQERLDRQVDKITRLLTENAELKGLNSTICDVCKNDEFLKETRELARAEGQEEAWKLATMIALDEMFGGYKVSELKEIFDSLYLPEIFRLTYPEAAAKVAEWERQNEICVGDVIYCEGHYGVVVNVSEIWVRGIISEGGTFQWHKEECTKTGRHIDVNAFLEQIGGESNVTD